VTAFYGSPFRKIGTAIAGARISASASHPGHRRRRVMEGSLAALSVMMRKAFHLPARPTSLRWQGASRLSRVARR